MANMWATLRGRGEKRFTISDYANLLAYDGHQYPIIGSSTAHRDVEEIESNFVAYVNGAYKANGVVFACMLARLMLFSEARFMWQRMEEGRPGDLFHTPELGILETPWPNGDTGELLARMIQDVDAAGNFYAVREPPTPAMPRGRLRRLRPDWVTIVLNAPPAEAVQSDVLGYLYKPGGAGSAAEAQPYFVDQTVHWSPLPDPDAQYRGMSWLTPVIREIQADRAATEHKLKFFHNGATLQTVLTLGESVTADQFKTWVRKFREAHQGVRNAYEPLFLGGGADAKVVGADLKQLDFKVTQGAGETRIASAAGMHPAILGLSEGLQGSSLNAGNFGAARRVSADKTLRPLWRSGSAALGTVVRPPADARLWWDGRDIAFLREDTKDLAEIQSTEGQTIRTLVDAGYEPESVTAAVMAQDWTLLRHTGVYSVQLQPPDSTDPADQLAEWDCRNNRLAWRGLLADEFKDAVAAARERYGSARVVVVVGTSTSSIGASEDAYRRLEPDGRYPSDLRRPIIHTYKCRLLHGDSLSVAKALRVGYAERRFHFEIEDSAINPSHTFAVWFAVAPSA